MAIEEGGEVNLTPEGRQRVQAGEPAAHGVHRYELEIEVKNGVATRILTEALRQKPNGRGKWQRVFERDADGRVMDSKTFSLSGFQHLVKTLASNHSVLSSFAKFQHPTARKLVENTRNASFPGATFTHSYPDKAVLDYLKTQPQIVQRLNSDLSRIDVGVEGLSWRDGIDGPELMFRHSGLALDMPWSLESHGTRAFIKMFP